MSNEQTMIMGQNVLNARQLAAFLLSREENPRINCTALELAMYFINEGNIEGVRGDIAFMQSIHETGWFRFGGQVLAEQNNYGGIGAVNNSPEGAGAWFDTPQLGVRAQIHHLKTYASTEPLQNENASPRAHFVTRGIAPLWTDLNGRWAVPGATYGQKILGLFDRALEDVGDLYSDNPDAVYAAIDILKIHGIINSPNYWRNNYGKLEGLAELIIGAADRLEA